MGWLSPAEEGARKAARSMRRELFSELPQGGGVG